MMHDTSDIPRCIMWNLFSKDDSHEEKFPHICFFLFLFLSICLDVPHLTNEQRTHHCTTS